MRGVARLRCEATPDKSRSTTLLLSRVDAKVALKVAKRVRRDIRKLRIVVNEADLPVSRHVLAHFREQARS